MPDQTPKAEGIYTIATWVEAIFNNFPTSKTAPKTSANIKYSNIPFDDVKSVLLTDFSCFYLLKDGLYFILGELQFARFEILWYEWVWGGMGTVHWSWCTSVTLEHASQNPFLALFLCLRWRTATCVEVVWKMASLFNLKVINSIVVTDNNYTEAYLEIKVRKAKIAQE